MSLSSQQQSSQAAGSFSLIWFYWFKKYMQRKNKKSGPPIELANIKQKYKIEAIEAQGLQGSTELKLKL